MHHPADSSGDGSFCRRTRREFFWEAGGSFTGLALAGLLDQDFARQTRAADGVTAFANPLAAKPPHFAPEGQERDLPVHVWRPEPRGYL